VRRVRVALTAGPASRSLRRLGFAILLLVAWSWAWGDARAAVAPYNLTSSGNLGLSPAQSVGQTFVTHYAGRLTGIEFAPQLDSASPTDAIFIEVFDGLGQSLGSSSILAAAFPPGNGVPAPLSLTTQGPGYFDLTALDVHFQANDQFSFVLTKPSSGTARAGASADVYPDGTSIVNGTPSASFDLAFKVVFTPEAKLLVGAANGQFVPAYNSLTGVALGDFTSGSPLTSGPSSLVLGGPLHRLYVKTWSGPRIDEFDGLSGAFVRTLVSTGVKSGGGQMAIGPDGRLYGPNSTNGISRWDLSTGALVSVFVAAGSGGLASPGGLAFGLDGNLYVGSINFLSGQHLVLKYNGTTGASLGTFVPSGSGGLVSPDALVFGPGDDLFVTSRNTNNVLRYSGTTGAFLSVFASGGGLSVPFGLTFGPDGNLFVSSMGTNSVFRYDGATGAFIDEFATNTNIAPSDVLFTEGELATATVGVDTEQAHAPGFELRPVVPNPITRGTAIEFDLPRAGEAALSILDVQGRSVRTLIARTPLDAGRHRIEWDARDASGRRVRPGVYLIRLGVGGEVRSRSVAVLD